MEHGALPKKNSPHAKFERACDKTTKIDSTFRGTFPMANFFSPSFLQDGMTSAPVGGLYWICLFFLPPPSLSLIYLFIICGVFWFFGRIFLFLHFFFFCAYDGMIYRVAGVKVRPKFLSFYFLDSLWNGRKKDAAIDACRHSWIEMKTDGRNALEALRNENDGRMCQNVNGLNSHSICQTMWNN